MIATGVTLPLVVILALIIGNLTGTGPKHPKSSASGSSTGKALGPVQVSAPPSNPAADAPCTGLLGKLPIDLPSTDGNLQGRSAQSSWTYVAAWGEPPLVLRCGVPRPAALTPGSSEQLFSANGEAGVYWLPVRHKKETVWTTVDRVVYVEVTVPNSYRQPPLSPIADAVAKALPKVCVVDPTETDVTKLCTHRP